MTTLLISDFKARCIEILNGVHDTGEPVVVTRRGKALAKIVPLVEPKATQRKLGTLAGAATAHGDIVHGTSESDWESAR